MDENVVAIAQLESTTGGHGTRITTLETSLIGKASTSTVTPLQTTVNNKASTSLVNSLGFWCFGVKGMVKISVLG